jgi:hypothetical protein
MADIASLLGRLTPDELEELRAVGPQGFLPRHLVDAVDRAAGGPGAGRGYYVPAGSVSATGSPHLILRSDVSDWLSGPVPQVPYHEAVESDPVPAKARNDWSEFRPGDQVCVVRGDRITARGTVDVMTGDATVVWLLFEGAVPRLMFHRDDPEELRPVR